MTEDEAKTKWCPFMQISIDGMGARLASNRGYVLKNEEKPSLMCMGSACMAWRWTDPLTVPQQDRRGCCGLAGRP